ncbi:transglutaminase-like cysteine peptidase [Bradyrhizobium sp. B117]|uniref:transglutaminase-like cysteine peptidase n=1 Tax=Bradyrhizobium sp. B117 TaxID=3140246 RepID=UPI0031844EE2
MRKVAIMVAGALAAIANLVQPSFAGLLGMPMGLQSAIQHIKLETPTLPPLAYTQFCLRYHEECRSRPIFRGGPIQLTTERWADLKEVNQSVNTGIVPEPNELGLAAEQWLINPGRGDCNDYAVSKRHELLVRGWPARALLLSEVVASSGEHHLVLVVRTKGGDFVLDNLTPQIKPWSRAPYRWVRVQSPHEPRLWATVAARRV